MSGFYGFYPGFALEVEDLRCGSAKTQRILQAHGAHASKGPFVTWRHSAVHVLVLLLLQEGNEGVAASGKSIK